LIDPTTFARGGTTQGAVFNVKTPGVAASGHANAVGEASLKKKRRIKRPHRLVKKGHESALKIMAL
jgi:hypothetical protein